MKIAIFDSSKPWRPLFLFAVLNTDVIKLNYFHSLFAFLSLDAICRKKSTSPKPWMSGTLYKVSGPSYFALVVIGTQK